MALDVKAKFQITGYSVEVPESGPVLTVRQNVYFNAKSGQTEVVKVEDAIFTGTALQPLIANATKRILAYVSQGVAPEVAYYLGTRDALYAASGE